MSDLFIIYVVSFMFGAIVGSFLNVCIYRIPAGQSIVSPPSSCPRCGHLILWYQNIPILSYLVLGGKCSSCHIPIALRYPAIEILSGLLFVVVFSLFKFSSATLIYWIFVSALIVVTFIDLDYQIIPDIISLPGIIIGFCCSFLIPWISWMDSLIGVIVGGGILLSIAWSYEKLTKREGMGGGDIKLLAMLGAFMGWQAVLPIIFLASLVGTMIGVPLMLIQKGDSKLAIPFGPFLASSAIVYLFWGPHIIHWYMSFFS